MNSFVGFSLRNIGFLSYYPRKALSTSLGQVLCRVGLMGDAGDYFRRKRYWT